MAAKEQSVAELTTKSTTQQQTIAQLQSAVAAGGAAPGSPRAAAAAAAATSPGGGALATLSLNIAAAAESTETAALSGKLSLAEERLKTCLLYTSPSPRDKRQSRMPSSA